MIQSSSLTKNQKLIALHGNSQPTTTKLNLDENIVFRVRCFSHRRQHSPFSILMGKASLIKFIVHVCKPIYFSLPDNLFFTMHVCKLDFWTQNKRRMKMILEKSFILSIDNKNHQNNNQNDVGRIVDGVGNKYICVV